MTNTTAKKDDKKDAKKKDQKQEEDLVNLYKCRVSKTAS